MAVLGAVVSSNMGSDPTPQQSQDAYNSAFTWAAAGVLIALFIVVRLPSLGADAPRPRDRGAARAGVTEVRRSAIELVG